ncbi:hypothetical protein PC116_g30683, partial [Phytophthora cactorum]
MASDKEHNVATGQEKPGFFAATAKRCRDWFRFGSSESVNHQAPQNGRMGTYTTRYTEAAY